MKIIRYEIDEEFLLDCNVINVLVVEDESTFQRYVFDFFDAINNGVNGKFVLSHGLEILAQNKYMIMVSDYFAMTINNKRNSGKLLKVLLESASDNLEIAKNVGEIASTILKLSDNFEDLVDFKLTFNENISIEDIIKLLNVRLEEKSFESLLEKLIDFVIVVSEFDICKIIVFVNLKAYLTVDELLELYKIAQYKKINLFLLENIRKEKIKGEKVVVIDKDKCEFLG